MVPGSHSLNVRGAPVSVTREGAIGTSATGSSMARSEASMAAQSSTATGTAVTNDGTASSSMVIVMAAPGCTGPSKPSTTVSLSAVCVTDSSVDPASTSPRTMAPSLVPVPDPETPSPKTTVTTPYSASVVIDSIVGVALAGRIHSQESPTATRADATNATRRRNLIVSSPPSGRCDR